METGVSIDWAQVVESLVRVVVAFALAIPVGWERESGTSSAGLRTFPVVAMAACGYALIVKTMPDATADSQARLLQGLLAGIGFIGGGAIVKNGSNVRGIVTAASIWNTGAIGASVAYGREEIAIVLSLLNFLTLLVLTPLEKQLHDPVEDDDVEQ
ncbi:putative Mg2+ transporter-C (MgtC) family protein [Palleronia marisminoris]|uniref:Protein MgtC n=1 Tax=Palleronia marisminoris TaxID=315423 RepID=A0A1Y5STB9_9RHOB|nr:MgtC/SapB family protein [Palleronia marisminoris]SFG96427.1 putative Mg2+ transporter-C (MgtC) family protein [Palleronia marisminoris]SLN47376.1 putative Mg(2+) transport ATPase [Palleronia marisminoris]